MNVLECFKSIPNLVVYSCSVVSPAYSMFYLVMMFLLDRSQYIVYIYIYTTIIHDCTTELDGMIRYDKPIAVGHDFGSRLSSAVRPGRFSEPLRHGLDMASLRG